jgi:hypothetical protein
MLQIKPVDRRRACAVRHIDHGIVIAAVIAEARRYPY